MMVGGDPASEEMVAAAEKALRKFVDEWDSGLLGVGAGRVLSIGELQLQLRWNPVLWERAVGRSVLTWLNIGDGGRLTVRHGSSGR